MKKKKKKMRNAAECAKEVDNIARPRNSCVSSADIGEKSRRESESVRVVRLCKIS